MAWITDELTHEYFEKTATTGVFNLTGAKTSYATFASATRRDGNPLVSGTDKAVVAFRAGAKFLLAAVTITIGAPSTLTVDGTKIYRTSEGDGVSIPDFDAGGEVYITKLADHDLGRDPDGSMIAPEILRFNQVMKTPQDFAAEVGTLAAEAVGVLGQQIGADTEDTAIDDYSGGLFAHNSAETDAATGKDILAPPSGAGMRMRVAIKPSLTRIKNLLAATPSEVLDVTTKQNRSFWISFVSEDGDAGFRWLVETGPGSGDGSGPPTVIDVYVLREWGGLAVDPSDNGASLRVTTLADVTGELSIWSDR